MMATERPVLVLPEMLMRPYCWAGGRARWHNRRYPSELVRSERGGEIELRRGAHRIVGRHLTELRGTHAGERAHVAASGPSVRQIERPELIGSQFTLAVNGAPAMFSETGTRIDAYLVDDPRFARNCADQLIAYAREARSTLLSLQVAAELVKRHSLEGVELYLFDHHCLPFRAPARPQAMPFATDIADGVIASGTVVFVALQILAYLGFRDIAVFGMDLSMTGRFYAEAKAQPQKSLVDFENRIVRPFRLARPVLDRLGVAVRNCSLHSALPDEIFPRTDANAYLAGLAGEARG